MQRRTYPRRGLHGELVHAIGLRIVRDEIELGTSSPGARLLNEDLLGAEFGASRGVVREAVKVLAAKGLVESRPRTGTRVRPRAQWSLLDPDVLAWLAESELDEQFLRDLTEVRCIVEPSAAELAAVRANAEDIATLGDAFREMSASVSDTEAYVAADLRFHAAILAASHNEILDRMIAPISAALRLTRIVTLHVGDSRSDVALHAPVLEAIRDRNPNAARSRMEALVRELVRRIELGLGSWHRTPVRVRGNGQGS
jgi:GntR family transcriptional regulator, galactonate operon transcriptional repressor